MNSIDECLPSCLQEMKVEREDDGNLAIFSIFSFPKTFPGFQGHFPDNPILPAIVQLSAVRFLAEKCLEKKLFPEKINRAKFRAMVIPEQQVHIELKLNKSEKGLQGRFKLHKGDRELIADGHCIFSEENN